MPMLSAPINITELFNGLALTAAGPLSGTVGDLFDDERKLIERANDKRKREFSAGRIMARGLLAKLGQPEQALLSRSDRTPIWPQGITGSISHCDDLCATALATTEHIRSLGLDVEPDAPLEDDLAEELAFGDELEWIEANGSSEKGRRLRMLFIAKEAAYKCQFPLTGAGLEFSDMAIEFDSDGQAFTAQLLADPVKVNSVWSSIRGRFLVSGGYLFGGAMIKNQGSTQ